MRVRAIVAYFLSQIIILQPVFAAGIAPAGDTMNMGTPSGPNNIPVLNTSAPTNAGVSHNKFNDFNVDPNGLIINNLNMHNYNPSYQSALSGQHIEFNRNFGTGDAARVILNEVVGNSVSSLRGATEIYGRQADYIVANPNGITCAGCSFINTGRLSMITGSPNMVGGDIGSFNISSVGTLRIDGVGETNFGLYAPSHADLISNAVRIAGDVYANGDLNIYSGNDTFDYKNKIVTSNNNTGVSVAVDSTAIGGMKANNIRIVATQRGFGINAGGNLIADMGNVEITADGNIAMKNTVATKNIKVKSASSDIISSSGGALYAQNIDLNAGRDFINKSRIETEKTLSITAGRDFQNDLDILSSGNLALSVLNDFTNTGSIQSNIDLLAGIGGNFTNDGRIYTVKDLTLDIGAAATMGRGSYMVASGNLNLTAADNFKNIGKVRAGGKANFDVLNLNNYGQILSNKNLTFRVANDLINYRASGILSGGNIDFDIARDLVNYKAEIYAVGDINFSGRDDLTAAVSGLQITPLNQAAMAAKYDNPYIAAEIIDVINPPVIIIPDDAPDAPADTQLKLSDGTVLTLPESALESFINPGDTYTDKNGYQIILGTEVVTEIDNPDYIACTAAGTCTTEEPKIQTYSYVGDENLTVKSPGGVNQDFVFIEPTDVDDDVTNPDVGNPTPGLGDIPVQNGGGKYSSSALNSSKSILDGYTFSNNLMGTLLNWAGRIESGGNMEINADQIMNRGFDINTGMSAATIETIKLRDKAGSRTPAIMWTQVLRALHFNSMSAQIISGGNLTLNGRDVLNAGSVISSRGDIIINAAGSIKNLTSSDVFTLQTKWESRKWRGIKGWKYSSYIEYAQKRVYSKTRSMIVSGGDLKIKSKTLENDQALDPLSGLGIVMPMPDDLDGSVSVDTRLPVGDNGLFHVVPDGKYLVESNVGFINPDDFIGSDYFFTNLGNGVLAVDTTRIIGDPAYETRLVTDAYVQATGRHWTDNDGQIGGDADMMRALYDGARDTARDMNLTVGIALTADQIANLQQDIIWYVEKTIDGHTVLVPQLYLSQATLDSLDGGSGSKISGVTLVAENEYMVNVGTIAADDLLAIKTDRLVNDSNDSNMARLTSDGDLTIDAGVLENRSALIAGDTVKITADELINETKKLTEDRNYAWDSGSKTEHVESASYTGAISATNGVDMDVSGKLHNTGAVISSETGDINITADTAVFDTLQLMNSKETQTHKSGFLGSADTTKISQSLANLGSEINAGGNLNIKTGGDATFAGTTVNVGGNADLDIGGNTNILAVMDSTYEYEKTDRSSWGGLVKEKSINEMSDQNLKKSNVNVVDGLIINTGKNLNLIASDVNVGGDADINAGDNINILSAEEVDTAYSYYKKTNYVEDLAKAAGTLALAAGTGGASLLVVNDGIDVNCSGGSCGASMQIGSQMADESYTKTTTSVGSGINIGGDLNMRADRDINIQGSDIAVGGDGAVAAGNNINVLESKNTTEQSSSHSDTTITSGVQVGNAYVDAGLAAKALYDAGDAVVKATEALKHMKELRDNGKASDEAVRDAELNLAMASLNLANAELAAVSSIASAASAAGTSFGTGMYGSASLNFDTNKSSSDLSTTQSNASNIFGNNLTFTSGNDMTQSGSNVGAKDTLIYDIKNDLNVLASMDTNKQDSDSQHNSAGVSIGNNAVQVSVAHDQSQNTSSSTTHNNSTVAADNVVIKTGNDATFAGANVNADSNLDMDIGGDLTVESVQDEHYAKGSNWGVNASGGTGVNGKSAPSGGGGFHVGSSETDILWTTDQTELTGGNVNIKVGEKTTVVGGMIASGNYDADGKFIDNGNLALDTKELEYKNLYDHNNSSESGVGLQTNWGKGTDQAQVNEHPNGSTTLTVKDKGHETDQTTHATIGGGSITVGGVKLADNDPLLAGLNRDVDNATETTRDLITGALDGSVTIDNRVLLGWIEQPVYETDENGKTKTDKNGNLIPKYEMDENGNQVPVTTSGWDQIADQHANLGKNAASAAKGAIRTVAGSAYAAYKTADGYLSQSEAEDKTKNAYEMAELDIEKHQQDLKGFIGQYVKSDMTDEQKLTRIEKLKTMPQTEATINERDALYSSLKGEVSFVEQRKQEAVDIVKSHTTDPQFWFMEFGWDSFNPSQKIEMADRLGKKQADIVGNPVYTPISYPDPYYVSMSDNTAGMHNYRDNKTYLNPNIMDNFHQVVGVVSHENSSHGFQTNIIIPNGGTTTSKAMELNRTQITRPNEGRNNNDSRFYPIYRTSPVEQDAFPFGTAVEIGVSK